MKKLASTVLAYIIVLSALVYCFRAATHLDTPAEAAERARQYELTRHAGCVAYMVNPKRPTGVEMLAYNKCMAK
jgi:hypothetical protein